MPFLSVIIPVYNVEPYLRQCVDSVLNQKLEDYELILVDDGSPDACPQICDEYASRFPQIRVIHQQNGGLSAARNAGLRAAYGQYVMFMDSDDWWNPDVSVQDMLNRVKTRTNVDMFLFAGLDYIEGEGYFDRSDSIRCVTKPVVDARSYYEIMLGNGNLQVSACTKFLKRIFLLENALFFTDGLLGEDNEWMIRLLRCASTIEIIPFPLYICRLGRSTSITNTIKKKNVSDLLQIVQNSIDYYQSPDADRSVMKYEFCFCAYLWFCALGLSQGLSKEEKTGLMPQFQKTAEVCRYSNSRKTKLAYAVYHTLGYQATAFTLGTYIQLKGKLRLNKKKV